MIGIWESGFVATIELILKAVEKKGMVPANMRMLPIIFHSFAFFVLFYLR